ncbi:hypothetical protein ACQY0O_001946 [Thecaphora frezii]
MTTAEDMSRGSSRTDSISTLWSSADVPFCLDPRVASGGHRLSKVDGFSKLSRTSSSSRPCSIDLERPSLSLVEERYFDYSFDATNNSGLYPEGSPDKGEPRHYGDLPRNMEGSIMEDSIAIAPFTASPTSTSHAWTKPKNGDALRPTLVHRDKSVPGMPASISSSSVSTGVAMPLVSAKSTQNDASWQGDQTASSNSSGSGRKEKKKVDLYAHARQFFEPDYSMDSDRSGQPYEGESEPVGPLEQAAPVLSSAFSDISHDDSVPSCSQSHASDRTNSGGSPMLPEPSDSMAPASLLGASAPYTPTAAVPTDAHARMSQHTPTQELPPFLSSVVDADKVLPSLPSMPSISPSLSPSLSGRNSPRGFASRHASRPRTAETSRDGSPNRFSPKRATKGPPTPLKIARPMTSQVVPTQAVFFETEGTTGTQGSSPSYSAKSPVGRLRPSTAEARLRSRALSTSRLRPAAASWKVFGGDAPALPSLPSALASRPSTSQVEGPEIRPKGRFRSRTVGEADRAVSSQPQPRALVDEADGERTLDGRPMRARRPSKSDTLASSAASSTQSFLLTSNSSVSPSTPSTPKSLGRPRAKSNASGWASYLTSRLTLHIDQEGHRMTQVSMSYLSYDPFGSPETLVGGSEAKQSTPKRPKSRPDKDGEAGQVGTLEFGQSDDSHQHIWPIHSSGLRSPPILKHLTIGDDTKADLLTRQAALKVKVNGVHQVGGYERNGQLAWKFVYRVDDYDAALGDKLLIPISFSCSATLLDPARARKSRILTSLRKHVAPSLVSKSVSGSPASAKQELPAVIGYVPSPPSSHRSHASLRRDYLMQDRGTGSARLSHGGDPMASPLSMRYRFDPAHLAMHSTPPTTALAVSPAPPLSAASFASTDSSSPSTSHPHTPHSGRTTGESISERSRLQKSPVSPQFGRTTTTTTTTTTNGEEASVQHRNLSAGDRIRQDLPPKLPGVRQSSLALQHKSSFGSEGGHSARGIQATGPPRMIGGRKLIPISLPPELQRKARIDPAQLLANAAVRSTLPRFHHGAIVPQISVPASASGDGSISKEGHRAEGRHAPTGRRRSQTVGQASSRPPTASESIKLEYLARQVDQGATASEHTLLTQRSHGTFILRPGAVPNEPNGAMVPLRQRSRTSEGTGEVEQGRPFTADAWGAAMYPPVEAVRDVLQQERNPAPAHSAPPRHQQHQEQRHQHHQHHQQQPHDAFKHPLVMATHLRPHLARPRTAQNLMPDHTARVPAAALVDASAPRVNA